jgi:site-specific recombinase XerD
METLVIWLKKRLSSSAARVYHHDIIHYVKAHGEARALHAGYGDVLNYIGTLRNKYSSGTVHRKLQSIKAYYQWLLEMQKRTDHPCRDLKLRDRKTFVQLQDLFKPEELELLMSREERYSNVQIKNQLMISLFIYQGLLKQEVLEMKLQDVKLEEGTIYVKSSGHVNSRILKLKGIQVILLQKYLQQIRPKLQRKETEILLLNMRGHAVRSGDVNHLIKTFKHLFPDRKLTVMTIRQSVITNLLKSGKDLRLVQTFAGHRKPSTTEKYKQTHVEELKEAVMKFHPLK